MCGMLQSKDAALPISRGILSKKNKDRHNHPFFRMGETLYLEKQSLYRNNRVITRVNFNMMNNYIFTPVLQPASQPQEARRTKSQQTRHSKLIQMCLHTLSHVNAACHNGGHYWSYYPSWWCLIFKSSQYNSFEDRAFIDLICGCPISKWDRYSTTSKIL